MALTPSEMPELGMLAPDFDLPNVSGGRVSLDSFDGKKALLVMFISKHCPYVQHVAGELARISFDYRDTGLGIVAISSNDIVGYPDDAPGELRKMVSELGFGFPVCFDESQEVAKAYKAACTPDFFLFDEDRILAYRGQLDDSRPGNDKPCNGENLRTAIDAVLCDQQVHAEQKPSTGCNIKWKAGNEPDYFSS
jgi:peroxiredoxin